MKLYILFCLVVITMSSCSTYQIPVDIFAEQFADRDPAKLNKASTQSPFGITEVYHTNILDTIVCFDKHNMIKKLKKSPSLEMRFTEKNGKKTIFYADQVFVKDSLICGERSKILKMKKCISLENVKKIEIQDGHKNYKYK